jgi:uncharacterized membrane-anchored protein YitT (DUF2179 family)
LTGLPGLAQSGVPIAPFLFGVLNKPLFCFGVLWFGVPRTGLLSFPSVCGVVGLLFVAVFFGVPNNMLAGLFLSFVGWLRLFTDPGVPSIPLLGVVTSVFFFLGVILLSGNSIEK